MRSARSYLAIGVVAVSLAFGVQPAFADPQDKVDASGRVLERRNAKGVTIWYVYGPSGELIEERHSDGVVIRHEQQQSKAKSPSESR